jgi:cell division protein FtsL
MIELVQFRTNYKQRLKEIAKSKGMSLNGLMIMIIEDYLKRVK